MDRGRSSQQSRFSVCLVISLCLVRIAVAFFLLSIWLIITLLLGMGVRCCCCCFASRASVRANNSCSTGVCVRTVEGVREALHGSNALAEEGGGVAGNISTVFRRVA